MKVQRGQEFQSRIEPGDIEYDILPVLGDSNNKVEPNNVGISYGCMSNCKHGLKLYGGNKYKNHIGESIQNVLGRNQARTVQAMHSGHEGTQIPKKMLFTRI